MGLHLDKELRKVQSLVSRTLARHQGGSPLEMLLFILSSRGDPYREVSDSFSFTIWETHGLSGKLLSKNHWDLEASQIFFGQKSPQNISINISEENDFLDLWPDILGFPDYICSLISK